MRHKVRAEGGEVERAPEAKGRADLPDVWP